jgi:hypothetical protein
MSTQSLTRPPLSLRTTRRPAPGSLLGISRAGVVVLLLLAVANGVFLYFLPGKAEYDYAWEIEPAINAAFLGAGYLAGTVATALVVFGARSWRSLRILPLPLVVLSVGLMGATLIHADRFRWDYAPTWVWTGVYAGVPFVVAYLWFRQERGAPRPPAAHPGLRVLRVASAVLGAILAAGSIALYAAPHALAGLWPWELTPLLARCIASWHALVATSLITSAVTLRRPSEAIIPYATLLSWSGLLLLLPLLHSGDVVPGVSLVAWMGIQVALFVLAAYALITSIPLARAGGERL